MKQINAPSVIYFSIFCFCFFHLFGLWFHEVLTCSALHFVEVDVRNQYFSVLRLHEFDVLRA